MILCAGAAFSTPPTGTKPRPHGRTHAYVLSHQRNPLHQAPRRGPTGRQYARVLCVPGSLSLSRVRLCIPVTGSGAVGAAHTHCESSPTPRNHPGAYAVRPLLQVGGLQGDLGGQRRRFSFLGRYFPSATRSLGHYEVCVASGRSVSEALRGGVGG